MHPVLPLVTRAHEEDMMRAVIPGERPCINDVTCHGAQLPNGHVLPRFMSWTECVVCLRARAFQQWLAGLGESQTTVFQLYRNIVGPGEYASEAIIQPCTCTFDGITDPIVRFAPDRLEWRGQTLVQHNVAYRVVPSLLHVARPPKQIHDAEGQVDIFHELLRCGLFCPMQPKLESGIVYSMQRALWNKGSKLSLTSTWIKAVHQRLFGAVGMNLSSACLAVRHRIVEFVQNNCLLRAELMKRHPQWSTFESNTIEFMQLRDFDGFRQTCRRTRYFRMNQEGFITRMRRLSKPGIVVAREQDDSWAREMHLKDATDKMILASGHVMHNAIVNIVPAPIHWAMPVPTAQQLVCKRCREFKGLLSPRPPKSKRCKYDADGHLCFFGQRNISYSVTTGTYSCFRRRVGGRKAKPIVSCGKVDTIDIIGNIVELFGVTHHQCLRCGILCQRNHIVSIATCGECDAVEAPTCAVCKEAKCVATVKTFANSGFDFELVHLCKDHRPYFINEYPLWHKALLLEKLVHKDSHENGKRYVPAVKRG